jgi:hypothetical protein
LNPGCRRERAQVLAVETAVYVVRV